MSKRDQILRIKQDVLNYYGESSNYRSLINEAFKFTEKGEHKKNFYHNLAHCYNVLELCYEYAINKNDESIELDYYEKTALFLAAIFHDYNHSGKKLSLINDKKNIRYAIDGLMSFKNYLITIGYSNIITFHAIFDIAFKAIKTTVVKVNDSKVYFSNKPKNRVEQILRDSDVTIVTTQLGMTLSKGLAKEMALKYNKNFREKQILFLRNVKLFTPEANYRREVYLDYLRENYV